jgi:hypothetical protein
MNPNQKTGIGERVNLPFGRPFDAFQSQVEFQRGRAERAEKALRKLLADAPCPSCAESELYFYKGPSIADCNFLIVATCGSCGASLTDYPVGKEGKQ